MHSIRVRITAITIAAILTSIAVVFLACSSTIQRENDQQSVQNMNLLCQNTQQSLEKYLESISQSVEMCTNIADDMLDSVVLVECGAAGSNSGQGPRTEEQISQLDAYMSDYSKQVQKIVQTIAAHTHGIVTYYFCINPDVSETEHGFFYSRVGKTGFAEQPSLDARELDPEDIGHTTWYYTPIKRGRPSWVGPYTAHFLNEMWINSFLVPVYKSGALIGILGMDIPVETMIDLVQPIKVYQTGFACLLDPDGHIIYHPDLEYGSIPDLENMSIDSDLLLQRSSGDKLIRYTAGGEERQMSFTTLSNGMKLVITAPTREINATWMRLVRVILLITAGVLAFYIVLLTIVMNLITRPLKRLTAASQRLAAADYDVELNYKGKDEVGVLTRSFSQMRDQIKLHIEDLNRRIYTDTLTGLPNMKHFFSLAEHKRDQIVEEGGCPTLLFFDLVGMKHFNRQFGFEEGDKLICAIAEILVRHFGSDCTSRLGQDHFATVIDDEHPESLLNEVFQEVMAANGGKTLPVRVGIYMNQVDEVRASVAIDRAKYASDQHRGSYVSAYYFFDSKMMEQAENARYIINHLDQAIRERWIQVYYQSIVKSADGTVCDEECLSRWFDPEHGMFSPGEFIPVLESARLIYKLDLYVLDQVLEKMAMLQEKGFDPTPHSINLSRSDFDACDIVEEICRRVDNVGISRKKISIEITESIIGSDFDFMKKQVERFQKLGFPVWMDDFGSGYSSLDVLQSIHFDVIKFDMSFMQRLDEGGESGRIILTHQMKMAIALGVDTICEGVETEDQVRFLQKIGCSKMQGYYFSKPRPLEDSLKEFKNNGKGGGKEKQ